MPKHKRPQIVETTIEMYSKTGSGVGFFKRQDGTNCLVEVPFTLLGECVSALLLGKKRGVYQSFLQEVRKPSPERVEPRCQHFGTCGGCRWQQMAYERQLKIKQKKIEDCLKDLLSPEVLLREIIPCQSPWQYRNKMEFTFSSDKYKKPYLGLLMNKGKGKVFNLSECHLPSPWFVDAVQAARQWWKQSGKEAYYPPKNIGSLQTLTLRDAKRTGDRLINLTVSGNPDYALKKDQLQRFVEAMRESVEPAKGGGRLGIFLTIRQIKKGQRTQSFEMHLYGADHLREIVHIEPGPLAPPVSLTFKISPAAFFQPNPKQAEKLYSAMLQEACISSNAVVYDLYCGVGALGIAASRQAKWVIGVELSKEAALDARENVALNGRKNVDILTGSVHEILQKIQQEATLPPPDIVMVDPPRAGLGPIAIEQIMRLSAKKVVYVSCNPLSQAEDMKELARVYQLRAIQPVDQFPHTAHIENIAILTKKR